MIPWFLAASTLVVMISLLVGGRKGPARKRSAGRSDTGGMPATREQRKGREQSDDPFSRLMAAGDPFDQQMGHRLQRREKHEELRKRMIQAGLYEPSAVNFFFLLRVVLMFGLAAMGFLVSRLGYLSMTQGILFGLAAGIAGTLAPGMWLDYVRRQRQTKVRRALPDALDVMSICLQGGLSLNGALSRVARELAAAHPLLAVELKIVERQIQMGRPTGAALRELANRFDLEELRSMASVVAQSERMGSSMVNALALFGDTLRMQRQQRAEEMAHKASVKMLFPMLICIFPAVMVVILGPAVIQVYQRVIMGILRNVH